MVAHSTPILNLQVSYNQYLPYFYLFTDVTCVHTIFDRNEVRPEVVLTAMWCCKVNMKSPIDSLTTVFTSVSLTSIGCNAVPAMIYVFGVVLTIGWGH
jgi:hypothetical protein